MCLLCFLRYLTEEIDHLSVYFLFCWLQFRSAFPRATKYAQEWNLYLLCQPKPGPQIGQSLSPSLFIRLIHPARRIKGTNLQAIATTEFDRLHHFSSIFDWIDDLAIEET